MAKELVGRLPRPNFLAIVSSHVLARMLATKASGEKVEFKAKALLNTEIEVEYFRNGGILDYVLRSLWQR